MRSRDTRREVLADAAGRAGRYLATLHEREVAPPASALAALARLGGPLPEGPVDPAMVVRLLDEWASPATVASAGPRYFGFVTGGTLPAALGAAILAAAWDQVSRSIPELLGPRCPIVQAPMAGGGDTPALVAADGEAGAPAGLGTLAA